MCKCAVIPLTIGRRCQVLLCRLHPPGPPTLCRRCSWMWWRMRGASMWRNWRGQRDSASNRSGAHCLQSLCNHLALLPLHKPTVSNSKTNTNKGMRVDSAGPFARRLRLYATAQGSTRVPCSRLRGAPPFLLFNFIEISVHSAACMLIHVMVHLAAHQATVPG